MRYGHGVVIGASAGIGHALVKRLAPEAASIVALSRRGHVPPVEASLQSFAVDVRDFDALDTAFATITAENRVDFVVNCVGVGFFAPIGADHSETWAEMLLTNVGGLLNLLSVIDRRAPSLGTLVHISSTAAHRPSRTPGNECYTASKVAARSIINGYRTIVHDSGRHTRVAMVSPGYVEGTDFDRNFFSKATPPTPVDLYGGQENLRPPDVADAIAGILSTPAHIEVDDLIIRPRGQAF